METGGGTQDFVDAAQIEQLGRIMARHASLYSQCNAQCQVDLELRSLPNFGRRDCVFEMSSGILCWIDEEVEDPGNCRAEILRG